MYLLCFYNSNLHFPIIILQPDCFPFSYFCHCSSTAIVSAVTLILWADAFIEQINNFPSICFLQDRCFHSSLKNDLQLKRIFTKASRMLSQKHQYHSAKILFICDWYTVCTIVITVSTIIAMIISKMKGSWLC